MNSKMNLVKPAIFCFAVFGAGSVCAAQIGGGSPPPPVQPPADASQQNTGATPGTPQSAGAAPAAPQDSFDRGGKSNTSSASGRNGPPQNSLPGDTGTGGKSKTSTRPAKQKK